MKPRKSLQILTKDGDSDDGYTGKDVNRVEVNEALDFIKKISYSHKDLYDAEQQREELEMMFEVSKCTLPVVPFRLINFSL